MLQSRSRVDTAQCIAGCVGESGIPVPSLFEELHERRARKGTPPDQMLRQYPFGVRPSHPARRVAENRRDAITPPLVVTSDGPAVRVGVELKFMEFPAERAAPAGYGDSDEGDEVLKCFDWKGTLPCLVCGVGIRNRARHASTHALFSAAPKPRPEAGKLPWRRMLRYSGKLGKKAERVMGGEHHESPPPESFQCVPVAQWPFRTLRPRYDA